MLGQPLQLRRRSGYRVGLIRPLEEVLTYENAEVVKRFAGDYRVSIADAEEIFLETKRWLWLCASAPQRIPLLSEARVIDLMWHTFLLFTRDYARFCEEYLGGFVHHYPRTSDVKAAWEKQLAADPEGAKAERRATLRRACEMVCDRLGPATLAKWCEEFPRRFQLE